ncbi:gamma-glutamyltransferase [candidate division KSB1 bacterium]|nr:MAG: gamma-glutamyltransferase [candidate division KSB1 bacterium]
MKKILLFLLVLSILIFSEGVIINASREPVIGRNGMVVSTNEIASRIGIEILKKGGNAIDAAVAVSYALAVVYPQAGNIGGGGFMIIRLADGNITAIDYRETAPEKSSRNMYLDSNGNVIKEKSVRGYLASGVPGTVAGLSFALEKFGTMKLRTLIKPAIELAKNGFPVSQGFSRVLKNYSSLFKRFSAPAKIFLKGKNFYKPGDILIQKDLAKTLRLIAEQGKDAFYRGKIAKLIEKEMLENGGIITRNDLANYNPKLREPVKGTYKGYTIYSMPPPSSGGIALIEMLNILEGYNIGKSGFNSSKTIHFMVEAEKRAYADRAQYLGDPDFVSIPVKTLLSKKYAEKLRKSINRNYTTPSEKIKPGNSIINERQHTTHFSIVDKEGNAVSCTTTLNSYFGSGVLIKGAGFFMNNEMDDFSSKPGSPNIYGLVEGEANAIEPGKRMLSCMTPTIVTKNGKLYMVAGTPGGATIITTVLQVILNVIEHKMDIQEAVDAPRFHHQWKPDTIYYEKFAISKDVRENLEKMGYNLTLKRDYGDAHAILVDRKNNILYGGADSRQEGKAEGY